MSEPNNNPNPKSRYPVSSSSSSSSSGSGVPIDDGSKKFSGHKSHINPPEREIPDPATLKDQWRYAIRQYSKWYSHAWGTAILAGTAFFALGWIIKGQNPISSFHSNSPSHTDKDKTNP
ncbi:hypothetical protein VNO77_44549 [Canavalia gladiata]|uniref:Uncharacterized protein n=1 Tax=Canavalia gladiata TaxID=3824 RepID=A0AAN9JW59_CANGL